MFGSEYSSLYSKVKSWSRIFLSRKELEGLAELAPNELYDSIGPRIVKPIDKNFAIPETPGIAEKLLKEQLYGFMYSSRKFVPSSMQDFLSSSMKLFEVENLKITCRALFYGHELEGLYRLEPKNRYQIENLRNMKSLADFQEYLSGSEYYRIAQDTFPRIEESGNTFYFEISLDNALALHLSKKAKALSSAERKTIGKTLFTHLQGDRLLWTARCRFQYGYSPEGTLALIPNHFKLIPDAEYLRILSISEEDVFFDTLRQKHFLSEDSKDPETALWMSTLKNGRKFFSQSPFGPGVFFGFWLLYLVFIRNLTTVLEAKAMKWPVADYLPLLVW